MRELHIALAGNPNCGKTTLFNRLTGGRQVVGNWPGVTVEKKEGKLRGLGRKAVIVDLPGLYSLSPYTPEEVISRRCLEGKGIDLILHIVDVTNLERNLYLTTQLMELGKPLVIALNMTDLLKKQGGSVDSGRLEQELGVPVAAISATTGEGIGDLLRCIRKRLAQQTITTLSKEAQRLLQKVEAVRRKEETGAVEDGEIAIADLRYRFVCGVCSRTITKGQAFTGIGGRIDRILTHRVWALPLFFLIMLCIFAITFGPPGTLLKEGMERLVDSVSGLLASLLRQAGVSEWLYGLLVEGVLHGVGAVLSFAPQILLLFTLLTLLEDSGYLARAAFVMDHLLCRLGLSGRAFVPMLMGFGCSVPAVLATRTLESRKDRRLTIFLIPFLSCSAKMPVYALFVSVFFAEHRVWVIFSLYLLGVLLGLATAYLFKNTILKGEPAPFVLELPPYHRPALRNLWPPVWQRLKDFLTRAGTLILAASVLVWFLQSYDLRFQPVEYSGMSILSVLGRWIAPVFTLCGFPDWRAAVSLLTGLAAKESVVSTMAVLFGKVPLIAVFTPLSAYAFMTFVLLYTPCVAAVSAIHREMGSLKWTLVCVFWQLIAAWFASACVYQFGSLISHFIRMVF